MPKDWKIVWVTVSVPLLASASYATGWSPGTPPAPFAVELDVSGGADLGADECVAPADPLCDVDPSFAAVDPDRAREAPSALSQLAMVPETSEWTLMAAATGPMDGLNRHRNRHEQG